MTPYQKYLASDNWDAKRLKVKKRDKFKCKYCEAKKGLVVHHLTYKRVKTVDGVTTGSGEIRRVNINAAPLNTEDYKIIKESGIGTYQIFHRGAHPPGISAMARS